MDDNSLSSWIDPKTRERMQSLLGSKATQDDDISSDQWWDRFRKTTESTVAKPSGSMITQKDNPAAPAPAVTQPAPTVNPPPTRAGASSTPTADPPPLAAASTPSSIPAAVARPTTHRTSGPGSDVLSDIRSRIAGLRPTPTPTPASTEPKPEPAQAPPVKKEAKPDSAAADSPKPAPAATNPTKPAEPKVKPQVTKNPVPSSSERLPDTDPRKKSLVGIKLPKPAAKQPEQAPDKAPAPEPYTPKKTVIKPPIGPAADKPKIKFVKNPLAAKSTPEVKPPSKEVKTPVPTTAKPAETKPAVGSTQSAPVPKPAQNKPVIKLSAAEKTATTDTIRKQEKPKLAEPKKPQASPPPVTEKTPVAAETTAPPKAKGDPVNQPEPTPKPAATATTKPRETKRPPVTERNTSALEPQMRRFVEWSEEYIGWENAVLVDEFATQQAGRATNLAMSTAAATLGTAFLRATEGIAEPVASANSEAFEFPHRAAHTAWQDKQLAVIPVRTDAGIFIVAGVTDHAVDRKHASMLSETLQRLLAN